MTTHERRTHKGEKLPGEVAIYCESRGEGAPLLLIAGLGTDSSNWNGVIARLPKQYRILTLDNRGAGRSSIPGKPYSDIERAEDVLRVLDHFKVGRAHVLGHSLGGFIAQELAIRYPERVDRLVLSSTAAVSSGRNNELFLKFYRDLAQGGDLEAWLREWTRWLFSPSVLSRESFVAALVKRGIRDRYRQQLPGFKGQIDAVASFDARGRLGGIKARTLVLEGGEDVLILPEEAEALSKMIPGSVYRCIPAVAHSIHMEEREVFVNIVHGFLAAE
jgi:pimeloyl-ACP methyl ester carboxylesterase